MGFLFGKRNCLLRISVQCGDSRKSLFWIWAVWDCGGSLSSSAWLDCSPLGDTLQGVSVMMFAGRFNWKGKIYPEFGWHHHNTWGLRASVRRNGAEHQHSPPSASWLWAPRAQPPCAPSTTDTTTPLNTVPAVMSGDLKINPMFLQLLRQASVIVIRKNTQHRVPSDTGKLQRPLERKRKKKSTFLYWGIFIGEF